MAELNIFEKIASPAGLSVHPEQCLRSRHKKSSCRLCLESCPTSAISFSESLEINNSLCQHCGICVNVCPTGVFELRDLSYQLLLTRVSGQRAVEFSCSSLQPAGNGPQVPCLGYLHEALLLGAVANGAQSVSLNMAHCEKCDFAMGLPVTNKSLGRANRILALFGLPPKISTSYKELGSNYSPRQSNLYSRREFFSYLSNETRSSVASAISDTSGGQEMSAKTRVTLEPRVPKKRSLLLESIGKLGQPATGQTRVDDLPFRRVEISDRCNGCGMCFTFCPTGALRADDQGGRQVIDFSLGYCLACNLCSDICPEGAIVYSTHFNPRDLTSTAIKILIEHEKSACPECGQTYIPLPENRLCFNCSKKKEMEEWFAKIR